MTCSGYNARYDWLNSIKTSFVKEKTKQKSRNKLLHDDLLPIARSNGKIFS